MNQYRTIDVARMIGIHVNTVRLYEKCGLIPTPERLENGYRVFTDLHVEQFKLARAAPKVEVLQKRGCASRPSKSSRCPPPAIMKRLRH